MHTSGVIMLMCPVDPGNDWDGYPEPSPPPPQPATEEGEAPPVTGH